METVASIIWNKLKQVPKKWHTYIQMNIYKELPNET